MKVKEQKDKDEAALQKELFEKQKRLFDLRTQGVTAKLDDPTQLGKVRKDIARIKTVMRQRQLQAATTSA